MGGKQEVNMLDEGGNAFKQEFDKIEGGTGKVDIRDMPRLIEGALGDVSRPWIKDRILKMLEPSRDGKVRERLPTSRESVKLFFTSYYQSADYH